MNRKYVVVPFWKELTKEVNWEKDKNTFLCVRYHFEMRFRQINEPSQIGEKIAVDGSPHGTIIEKTTKIYKEREVVSVNETIQEAIVQNETLAEITGIISKKIKILQNESNAELKTKVQHKITKSFRNNLRILNTIREKQIIEFEIKTTRVESQKNEPIATVAIYQKQAIDIFLCLVDYLEINYKRSLLGIRKKRQKYPPTPINQYDHNNFILYNKPVATIEYWKLLPTSCRMIPESEHIIQVEDPGEIFILPPKTSKCSYLEKPIKPTLYQISNATFPLKWIKRKTDYTEDELIKMEDEEIKKLVAKRQKVKI